MALSSKVLMDGESVVLSTRTHIKILIVPFLLLVAVSFATAYLAGLAGDEGDGWVRKAILLLALVLFVVGTLVPFLRWLTWTYHLTDRRLIERKGILTRTGRVIPLNRVNDVSYEKSLTDRILGCGTLIIRNAAEEAGLELRDIPHVEAVARELSSRVQRADAVD